MTDLLTTPDNGPNGTIKRDRWGRYELPHPHTGKVQAWTRVTTLSSTLADRFGLEKWMQRNIVYGLGQRQDLYARAAAARLEDKDTLTAIVNEAQTAAADKAGANLGSAIHQFTERIDRGEPVTVPPPYDRDVAAYQQAMEAADIAVTAGWVERVVCIPELEVVGTLDRLVEGNWPLGHPRVADVKTGKDVVKYGMTEIALQLALYANATHWWDGTRWHPMIPVDRAKAVVIHLPVGQGTCTLYEVDIAAGWQAVQLAVDVRNWRKRRDLAQQIPAITPAVPATDGTGPDSGAGTGPVTTTPPAAQIAWIKARVKKLIDDGHGPELATQWSTRRNVPTFKQGGPTTVGHIQAITEMCDLVEKNNGLPFGPSDPTRPPATKQRKRDNT